MDAVLRRPIFALPFGCLVAIATHFVRFGDEHDFGGGAHDVLVSGAIVGAFVIAIAVLHAFVRGGSTLMTGTVAAQRMRALIPDAPTLFALAAGTYYGIETLEGNGVEIGLPTAVLALFSLVVAWLLRSLAALVATVVAEIIRDWLAQLDRRERLEWHSALRPQPLHAQPICTNRRLGRAPPHGRRL